MNSLILDHAAWSQAQWQGVQLGDKRLARRAVAIGAAMAAAAVEGVKLYLAANSEKQIT